MNYLLFILFLTLGPDQANTDLSMAGIRLQDPVSKISQLKLKQLSREDKENSLYARYQTVNGNEFTVTLQKGKVVYMENDWITPKGGDLPLITNFRFGKTSLQEIMDKFSTN